MDASGALSNLGQYCACVAAVSRIAWYCSKSGDAKLLPSVFGVMFRNEPVVSIVSTSLIILGLTAISFDYMVQMFLFARVFNLCGIFAAFVKLRFSSPDAVRPFSAPGNAYMSILYGVPTFAIGVHGLVYTDLFVWVVNGVVVVVALILFAIKLCWSRSVSAQLTQVQQKYRDIK